MPAKPIPGPHWLHPQMPNTHLGKPPPPLPMEDQRYNPSTFQNPYGVPHRSSNRQNSNPPRPPKAPMVPPPSYGQCIQHPLSHKNNQNPYENHRLNTSFTNEPQVDRLRGSGRTLQSWNSTNVDDDGASTTSGSYVVDSSDLFMDDYPPVKGVVV